MTAITPHAKRHLLILAYYFPPMGLSGVQRVSKMVKYLPDHGWDVTVVTARPGGYFAYDETLLEDLRRPGVTVVRTASVDPTRLFARRRVVGLPAESRRRRANWLTQALLVPDNKLGWYPFARRAALKVHRSRPLDAVLASAPPYTALLAARSVAQSAGVPFLADFRDDWVGNPRHEYPTPLHRRVHTWLEHQVMSTTASAITINDIIADSLRRRSARIGAEPAVHVLPQGFDPDDFRKARQTTPSEPGKMRFLYSGIFYDAQTPAPFLDGLRKAIETVPDMRSSIVADFVGLVPADFQDLVQSKGLDGVAQYHGYESHDRVVARLAVADVLWLTIGNRPGAEGISTGKLYEYFGARRPVLGLVPPGVARRDLESYGAAQITEPDDVDGIARAIVRMHGLWKNNELPEPDQKFVERFDRQRLAAQMADILDDAVGEASRT